MCVSTAQERCDLKSLSYEECLDYIHSFFLLKKKAGLLGISELLKLLDNPQDKLKFVHIAGTNGKGSTTAMTASVLKSAGYKVGIFTSPYIVDFRERFVINDTMIPKEQLCSIVNNLIPLINSLHEQDIPITEFEVVTAIGMCYFASECCDIVCLEVGIGGLFDSTNVIDTPLVACITSISLDHTSILGDTIEQIAFEKSGIIKANTIVVTYPLMDITALAVIMKQVYLTNSTLITPNGNSISIIQSDINKNVFSYNNTTYSIPLVGTHQIYNALCAIEICKVLCTKGFPITDECLVNGLSQVRWMGRLEVISTNPLLIIDGAHNCDGTLALANTIKSLENTKKIVVMGMLKDKDFLPCAKNIAECADIMFTVNVDNPRSLDSATLASHIDKILPTYICDTMQDGIDKAIDLADETDAIILCGSLYLIGEFKQKYKEID